MDSEKKVDTIYCSIGDNAGLWHHFTVIRAEMKLVGAVLKISSLQQLKQLKMNWYYIMHDVTLHPVGTNLPSISDFQFYTRPAIYFSYLPYYGCLWTSSGILLIFILLSHTIFHA